MTTCNFMDFPVWDSKTKTQDQYIQEILSWAMAFQAKLDEMLKAEKVNYETAKACPTPKREIDSGDLMSRTWGRLTLLRDIYGLPIVDNNQTDSSKKSSEGQQ